MPYNGERPEALTDAASTRASNVRVAWAAGIAGAVLPVSGVAELLANPLTSNDGIDLLAGVVITLIGLAVSWAGLTM